jgi:hypothetical protein
MTTRTRTKDSVEETPSSNYVAVETLASPTSQCTVDGLHCQKTYHNGLATVGRIEGQETFFQVLFSGKVGQEATITDVPKGLGNWYNPVSNHKETWANPALPFEVVYPELYLGYGLTASISSQDLTTAAYMPDSVKASKNSLRSATDLKKEAIANLQIGIETHSVSLPTVVGELRDFKDIFRGIGSSMRRIKKMRDLDMRTWKKFKNYQAKHMDDILTITPFNPGGPLKPGSPWTKLGKLAKTLGLRGIQADLFYKFAIKPLINDLNQLEQLGKHIDSQRRKLFNKEPFTVRASAQDSGDYFYEEEVSDNYGLYGENHITTEETRAVTVCLRVQWDHPSQGETDLNLYLKSLGFRNLASTAWELVPLSFVADYVVGIGERIRQVENLANIVPSYTLLGAGYSVKETLDASVRTTFVVPEIYPEMDVLERRGKYNREDYSRTLEPHMDLSLMSNLLWPKWNMPSPGQLVTLAELIIIRAAGQ